MGVKRCFAVCAGAVALLAPGAATGAKVPVYHSGYSSTWIVSVDRGARGT